MPETKQNAGGRFSPRIKQFICSRCGECLAACKFEVFGLSAEGTIAVVNAHRCKGCYKCLKTCPPKAIQITFSRSGPDAPPLKFISVGSG